MSEEPEKISTSALAKKLDIPAQQLFVTLKDYGWIQRFEDGWVLTGKGEFEGGSYIESRRFGRYIVWPRALESHRLVSAVESNQRISATGMQRYYPKLHPRQINRALAELGLQTHSVLGWELTDLGKRLGGQERESENSGAFYVSWPHEVVDHPVVHRELMKQSDSGIEVVEQALEDDLFARPGSTGREGVDGHILHTALEQQVCNWLYLAQLAHAYRRALPIEQELYADFYLPGASMYIECWEEQLAADELALKLKKQDIYQQQNLRIVDIKVADGQRLDEILGRSLLKFGIRV